MHLISLPNRPSSSMASWGCGGGLNAAPPPIVGAAAHHSAARAAMCSGYLLQKPFTPAPRRLCLRGCWAGGVGGRGPQRVKARIASRQKAVFGGKGAGWTGHVARSLPPLPQLDLGPGWSSCGAKRAVAGLALLPSGGGWRLAPAKTQHAVFPPTWLGGCAASVAVKKVQQSGGQPAVPASSSASCPIPQHLGAATPLCCQCCSKATRQQQAQQLGQPCPLLQTHPCYGH